MFVIFLISCGALYILKTLTFHHRYFRCLPSSNWPFELQDDPSQSTFQHHPFLAACFRESVVSVRIWKDGDGVGVFEGEEGRASAGQGGK